eukprot:s1570_g4.t1
MSETAATEVVQKKFAHEMRSANCKVLWSPPVVSLSETKLGHASQRGKASGVAAAAKIPIRPARIPIPDEWSVSSRMLHCIVRFGQSHCQLMVLYCRPISGAGAVEFNNQLLEAALRQLDKIPLPFLILGDMNMDVASFQSWPLLESQGCRSLDQLHQKLYAVNMPFTCKQVTRPDNAIVSQALAPYVSAIQVLDTTWFATHAPVIFHITLPGHTLFVHHLRFPRSFVELDIDDQTWKSMQDTSGALQAATTIPEWGAAVETQIDHVLRHGLGSTPKLGKAFRGRCQHVKFIKCPLMAPTKVANKGSFEPSTEVLTIASRRQVTQVRRLESLHRRLCKFEKDGPKNDQTVRELTMEWHAILRSHCFGGPFLHWICAWPEVDWPGWPLPTSAWTFQALHLVQYETNKSLKRDEHVQQQKIAYARVLDGKNHHKTAYATVRGPGFPRVSEIGRQVTFDAIIVSESGSRHTVYADADDIEHLSCDFPVALGEHQAKIVDLQTHCFVAVTAQEISEWESQTHVVQHQFVIHPGDLAKHLDQFWQPIWNRDDNGFDFVDMTTAQMGLQDMFAHLPPHPDIHVDMLDPVAWTHAVKRLKAGSARGTDLISAQELKLLPWTFLRELARILASYKEGFPTSFMHGLVCPLSKTDEIPRADQTRPITVLPQLYRLWAGMITFQITRVLCAWVPLEVTGLLPKRGAASTAYRTQFVIEQARRTNSQLSGVTLDLKKCFNCIRWSFGYHAMLAMGIPESVLRIWIGSLRSLTRHWLLCNRVFTLGQGTCGFPEGDHFSVLVMISLAATWITQARSVMPNAEASVLSAYADNWSWLHALVHLHLPVFQKTIMITQAAGVEIDMNKTWFWTTAHRHAGLIRQYVDQCMPGCDIQQKASAADLGFQLQYSGSNELGIATTRLQKALKRLERLQAMPHPLGVKEKMLRTSIFPAALHGAEIKPPSGENLQFLRSKSAHALFGAHQSLSPAIALVFTCGGILDPEFWLLTRAIATARSFLLQQSEATCQAFFRLCSQFRGSLQQVHGPAAALAFMLCNVDWKLDAQGSLHVTAFLSFPLLGSSMQRISRFLRVAWLDRLVMLHTSRTKWYHLPDISLDETLQVLNKYEDSKRWKLIREIAGAFQTANQKQKWLPGATGSCEFCNQGDGRRHRLLHCPIGAHLRESFSSIIAELEAADSLLPDHLVIAKHPNLEALQAMFFAQPLPCWGLAIKQHVANRVLEGRIPHWYTDGSCMHPTDKNTRHAAFAVVLDLCCTDDERRDIADRYRGSSLTIPTFQVVCTARCQGEQDILRAELSAIVTVAEEIGRGVLHVDSQAAMSGAQLALTALSPCDFASCDHTDLLMRLWRIRHQVGLSFVKVKSHQNPDSLDDPLLRYMAMGNNHVDCAANFACHNLCRDLVSMLDEVRLEFRADQKSLEALYDLHLLLQDN